MDLVFNALPDVFSYSSLRHATYDASWLADDKRAKGRSEPRRAPADKVRSGGGGACSGGGGGRDACPLCLEKQRRPLATYIRSKSRQDRKEEASIREEEEEEEGDEAGDEPQPLQTPPASKQ